MARKSLSLKTRLASALLALGHIPYADAKEMTADQLISLYHFDHGMLHESEHPQRDMYWNITPRLIKAHRDKTKQDAAIIAKGRRIRKRQLLVEVGHMLARAVEDHRASPSEAVAEALTEGFVRGVRFQKRKLRSRGFDKTRRRRMDGTVTKR